MSLRTATVFFGIVLLALMPLSFARALGDTADKMCSPFYAQCGCDQVPNPKTGKCEHKDPEGELPHSNVNGCPVGVCLDITKGHTTAGICPSANVCKGVLCDGKPCPGQPEGQGGGTPNLPMPPKPTEPPPPPKTEPLTNPLATDPIKAPVDTSLPGYFSGVPSFSPISEIQNLANLPGGADELGTNALNTPNVTPGFNSTNPLDVWTLTPSNMETPGESSPGNTSNPYAPSTGFNASSQPQGGNIFSEVGDQISNYWNGLKDSVGNFVESSFNNMQPAPETPSTETPAQNTETAENPANESETPPKQTNCASETCVAGETGDQKTQTKPPDLEKADPEVGKNLKEVTEVMCALKGCDPNMMTKAMGGMANMENHLSAEGCNSSGYCGVGQMGSRETAQAFNTLKNLANSSDLTPEQQSKVQEVVASIKEDLRNGDNPNNDPKNGAWLSAAYQMNNASIANTSPMEVASAYADGDPQKAAAIMQLGQMAPSALQQNPLLGTIEWDQELTGSQIRALNNNLIDVSKGDTIGDALDQIQNHSIYSQRFSEGIAWQSQFLDQPSATAVASNNTPTSFQPTSEITSGTGPSRSLTTDSNFSGNIANDPNPLTFVGLNAFNADVHLATDLAYVEAANLNNFGSNSTVSSAASEQNFTGPSLAALTGNPFLESDLAGGYPSYQDVFGAPVYTPEQQSVSDAQNGQSAQESILNREGQAEAESQQRLDALNNLPLPEPVTQSAQESIQEALAQETKNATQANDSSFFQKAGDTVAGVFSKAGDWLSSAFSGVTDSFATLSGGNQGTPEITNTEEPQKPEAGSVEPLNQSNSSQSQSDVPQTPITPQETKILLDIASAIPVPEAAVTNPQADVEAANKADQSKQNTSFPDTLGTEPNGTNPNLPSQDDRNNVEAISEKDKTTPTATEEQLAQVKKYNDDYQDLQKKIQDATASKDAAQSKLNDLKDLDNPNDLKKQIQAGLKTMQDNWNQQQKPSAEQLEKMKVGVSALHDTIDLAKTLGDTKTANALSPYASQLDAISAAGKAYQAGDSSALVSLLKNVPDAVSKIDSVLSSINPSSLSSRLNSALEAANTNVQQYTDTINGYSADLAALKASAPTFEVSGPPTLTNAQIEAQVPVPNAANTNPQTEIETENRLEAESKGQQILGNIANNVSNVFSKAGDWMSGVVSSSMDAIDSFGFGNPPAPEVSAPQEPAVQVSESANTLLENPAGESPKLADNAAVQPNTETKNTFNEIFPKVASDQTPGQGQPNPGFQTTGDETPKPVESPQSQPKPVEAQPAGNEPSTSKPLPSECSGSSVNDCLNALKSNTSLSSKEQLASKFGLSCESGSASCNTQLLKAIQNNQGLPVPLPASRPTFDNPYTPAINYTGNSLVDFLKQAGQSTSFDSRETLAERYGISNYTGTASQNTQLLQKLKSTIH